MSSWKCHAMYVYNIYIYMICCNIILVSSYSHSTWHLIKCLEHRDLWQSGCFWTSYWKNNDWTSAEFSIFGPSQLHHPPKKTWLRHPRNSCSATPEELAMAVQEWRGYPKWLFCNMPTFNGEHDDQPVNSFPNVQTLIKQSHQVMRPNMLSLISDLMGWIPPRSSMLHGDEYYPLVIVDFPIKNGDFP